MSPTKRMTRLRAHAVATAIPATTAKKDPRAAKKTKQTVNINPMFENAKAQRQRREREHCDVLAPKPAGIKKSPAARNGGFLKQFATGGGEDAVDQMFDPDYFIKRRKIEQLRPELPTYGFAELTSQYMKEQDKNLQNVQERHARSIAARRGGLLSSEDDAAHGKRPWIPTAADIDALTAQIDELNRPVEDDILKVQWHQPNGTVTDKSERLGDIIDKLQQRIERRSSQIRELEKQRRKVVKEIETLTAEVQGESDWSKVADGKFEAQMQALQDEIEQVDQLDKAELDKLKKEERAAAKKLSDKINELWDSIA